VPAPVKKAEKKKSLELLRQGKNAREAAVLVGVNPTTVSRWAKAQGIVLPYPANKPKSRKSLVDTADILYFYRQTHQGKPLYTLEEIAVRCQCSVTYVKTILRRKQCPLRRKRV
jgi:transposase